MKAVLIGLSVVGFLAYGLAQIAAGVQGVDYHWGGWWAWGFVFAAFAFRFTLPLTIAAFFGARDVWNWHWAMALLFAAPGVVFMVPAMVGGLLDTVRGVFRRNS